MISSRWFSLVYSLVYLVKFTPIIYLDWLRCCEIWAFFFYNRLRLLVILLLLIVSNHTPSGKPNRRTSFRIFIWSNCRWGHFVWFTLLNRKRFGRHTRISCFVETLIYFRFWWYNECDFRTSWRTRCSWHICHIGVCFGMRSSNRESWFGFEAWLTGNTVWRSCHILMKSK